MRVFRLLSAAAALTFGFADEGLPADLADGVVVYGFGGAVTDGVPSPWELKASTGRPEISVAEKGDTREKALHVKSENASFFLADRTTKFDPARHPRLRWTWKGVALPTGGDIRTAGEGFFSRRNKNDQALQVVVTFEDRTALSYVWDTTAPVDTVADDSTAFLTIKAVVVESGLGGLDGWRSYERNVVDDYRRAYGRAPRRVVATAVQSNCNHTDSKAEGYFGPISFSAP